MKWARLVGAGLSVLAITACGDSEGSAGRSGLKDETPVPTRTPEVLTVACTEDATAVDTKAAAARSSGLSVQIVDETDRDLVVMLEGVDTGKAVYVEGDGGHAEIAPGTYFVRCVDLDAPEHMEPARDSKESQRVEMLASTGDWTPQRDLACERRAAGMRDYGYSGEPDADRRSDPVEPVVRGDSEVRQWLHDGDQLVITGYREAQGRRVEVVRDDAVVGLVHLTLGPAGWFITSTENCADN